MNGRGLLCPIAAFAALVVASAAAHSLAPEEILRRLGSTESRDTFDVREVRRDPALPRLLVVRVGSRWSAVSAAQRTAWAEEWQHAWRSSVRNGIFAVLAADSDEPVVNFDASGRARLSEPPAKPTADPH